MRLILYNDQLVEPATAIAQANSPALRWGVGLIESMYLENGRIRLLPFHTDRLRTGMMFLGLAAAPDQDWFYRKLPLLDHAVNGSFKLRLQIMAEAHGGWSYMLEAESLPVIKTSGLRIDVYPYGRKPMDALAGMKTSSHLLYHLAGAWARQQELDEALVLNNQNLIADGSRTNLFLVKGGKLLTPAPAQGGVGGVMRRAVIEGAKAAGIQVRQEALSVQDALQADEVFLTNAVRGIMSVQEFRDRTYPETFAQLVWQAVQPTFC